MATASSETLADVLDGLQWRIDDLPPGDAVRLKFLAAYRRVTAAVAAALADAGFEDPAWVERWDVAFADLLLAAHDASLAHRPADLSRPWRLALDPPENLPPLRPVLLAITAHVNYDLPQAVLATIPDDDFADPAAVARRRRDLERVEVVLAARVAGENIELGPHPLIDRMLAPLSHFGIDRVLRAAREQTWRNVEQLQAARLLGEQSYRARLAELEVLTAARITDLTTPGPVLLRLAAVGLGVLLPPAETRTDNKAHADESVSAIGLPRQRTTTAQRREWDRSTS